MFSPETRTVAMDLLRPPPGWRLDAALLTTYSLDLDTLLALPLAILACADGGLDELLEEPLRLLVALREAAQRVHVFVDRAGIGAPLIPRSLFALLEPCVHPVVAPGGGAFHPKLWLARFVPDGDADTAAPPALLRMAVLSRNLTDDRSWDLALASEARPGARQRYRAARPLAELLRALPGLCLSRPPETLNALLAELADAVERTRFPAPAGCDGAVRFHCLGLGAGTARPWRPVPDAGALLAMAPFVDAGILAAQAAPGGRSRTLIARGEALDALPAAALDGWEVLVLGDAADGEPDDRAAGRPSGLHAKAIGFEQGRDATWLVGSANLTQAAFRGRNVEVMAEITGRRGPRDKGLGLERFRAGIAPLCTPYFRQEPAPADAALVAAEQRLEQARHDLAESDLRLAAVPAGDDWTLTLDGTATLPADITAVCWPISIRGDEARALRLPVNWRLPGSRLTAFVAFRLRAVAMGADAAVPELAFTLKLPAAGLPDGRVHEILRVLIDSPERLLRFLRALLGGLEGLMDWGLAAGDDDSETHPALRSAHPAAWSDAAVLEDLVRAAARDPARLQPVRRLLVDLCASDEGRRLVPDGLLALWQAVDAALGGTPDRLNGATPS
ncbi:MAG: phospholipase D family protein [Thiohalocapsa sp.]|jgi:hypothetical protein|uniref:phospholipase D family protein n=1 Tax=Thiohalocapsa sp. TaxID=2497641 RepID=UPI0025E4887D|nr:phospholipase D family protein [Thiohalocapsa sp.]MCG6942836.1 phospholipase D family protein [Thiohalocapsa sp.]